MKLISWPEKFAAIEPFPVSESPLEVIFQCPSIGGPPSVGQLIDQLAVLSSKFTSVISHGLSLSMLKFSGLSTSSVMHSETVVVWGCGIMDMDMVMVVIIGVMVVIGVIDAGGAGTGKLLFQKHLSLIL